MDKKYAKMTTIQRGNVQFFVLNLSPTLAMRMELKYAIYINTLREIALITVNQTKNILVHNKVARSAMMVQPLKEIVRKQTLL